MGWDYTPDHVGTGAYLRSDPSLRSELERRAYLGLAVARSLAPRRTGRLAESGHVESGPGHGIHGDRMQFTVVFDIDYAAGATWPNRTAYLEAAQAVMEAGG